MSISVIAAVVVALLCFIAGWCIATIAECYKLKMYRDSFLPVQQPSSFFATKLDKRQSAVEDRVAQVSIDERKFVTDIKTDTIQKVTEIEMGKTTTQQDTINQSVSKLAQLKGR
mgnify:CR=1 FL=1